jgi:hypothetical protein
LAPLPPREERKGAPGIACVEAHAEREIPGARIAVVHGLDVADRAELLPVGLVERVAHVLDHAAQVEPVVIELGIDVAQQIAVLGQAGTVVDRKVLLVDETDITAEAERGFAQRNAVVRADAHGERRREGRLAGDLRAGGVAAERGRATAVVELLVLGIEITDRRGQRQRRGRAHRRFELEALDAQLARVDDGKLPPLIPVLPPPTRAWKSL